MKKKIVNMRDSKEMLELMKVLYGNDEVKDDQTHNNTHREPGTKVAGKVVESSSTT